MTKKVAVIRHCRENVKKCSLRGLHDHPDFEFFKAGDGFSFDATGYILLEIDAPAISPTDAAWTQMAWRLDILSFNSSGKKPMLCLMR